MDPERFTEIKKKIEQSGILSSAEKKEWLFLLPKMNPEQIKELDRILSITMPIGSQAHLDQIAEHRAAVTTQITEAVAPKAWEKPRSGVVKPVLANIKLGSQINDPGKVRTLSLKDLRLASSVYTFLEALGVRLRVLVKNQLTTPDEITVAFERSPLYQDYLDTGLKIMAGEEPSTLTHHEIEAIADFRASLKKTLTN